MGIDTTSTFSPDIGDLLEEAYERAGLEMRSGYDMRTARRSMNLLLLEWQNKGINLWTVDEASESVDTDALAPISLVLERIRRPIQSVCWMSSYERTGAMCQHRTTS